jgi:hypothetical protein
LRPANSSASSLRKRKRHISPKRKTAAGQSSNIALRQTALEFTSKRGTVNGSKQMAEEQALSVKAVLMLGVALDGLAMIEGEPDISKVRKGIASVQATLSELLAIASKEGGGTPPRPGL